MIFSRRRGSGGRHHRDDDDPRTGRHAAGDRPDPDELDDEPADTVGPYDVTEAPDFDETAMLDLGALKVPVVADVEIRVQAGEDGAVQQVVLVHGDNALQLGVFAAPRTEGIWEETRTEIKASLFADGVAAEEVPGEYGTELRARVRTPEGLNDLRFVGIDGPRWMVRAIYQGKVAVDPSVAAPLVECLRNLVVDRGKEPMPAREALPLRLPKEAVEQAQAQAAAAATDASPTVPRPANGTPPRPTPRPGTRNPRKPSPRPRRSS